MRICWSRTWYFERVCCQIITLNTKNLLHVEFWQTMIIPWDGTDRAINVEIVMLCVLLSQRRGVLFSCNSVRPEQGVALRQTFILCPLRESFEFNAKWTKKKELRRIVTRSTFALLHKSLRIFAHFGSKIIKIYLIVYSNIINEWATSNTPTGHPIGFTNATDVKTKINSKKIENKVTKHQRIGCEISR